MPLLINQVKNWGIAGGLSILDQGVFSGANLIITILLARWLDVFEFGQFAIALAVIAFFMQIYTSFALEPMGIIGPSNYGLDITSYLSSQITLLFVLVTPLGFILALIALVAGKNQGIVSNSSILVISLFGLPLIFFPLLMRRIYYILLKPAFALIGSCIYLVTILIATISLKQAGMLTGATGIIVTLLAGLISGFVLFLYFKNFPSKHASFNLGRIFLETWNFGKWLTISGLLIGVATQSQVYLTGILASPEEAGAVRVLQTLIQPMMLVSTALSSLTMPALASDFSAGNLISMQKKVVLFMVVLGLGTVFYLWLLIFYGSFFKNSLFGEKYVISDWLIIAWGFVPIILSLFWGGVMALQVSQKPFSMLIISTFWGGVSLLFSMLFIPSYGVWGATISIIAGFSSGLVTTWILYFLFLERQIPQVNIEKLN